MDGNRSLISSGVMILLALDLVPSFPWPGMKHESLVRCEVKACIYLAIP